MPVQPFHKLIFLLGISLLLLVGISAVVPSVALAQGFSCSTVSEIPQSECEALVTLYNNTDGSNWTNNSDWLTTPTPCSWYGINCDSGHVVKVLLQDNQLNGTLPTQLGNLTSLWDLNLGNNQLTGSIPATLGNLSADLGHLYLAHNQLSGNIPVELGNLSNLGYLFLHDNQLTGNIPPELGNLTNLQELLLNENQLSGTIPTELNKLTNVRTFSLSANQLTGSVPSWLSSLSNLRAVELCTNQLSGNIPTEWGNLNSLEALELCDNQLTGNIPASLATLSNLKILSLSWNQLTGPIPPELSSLNNLQVFAVADNQLTGTVPTWLGSLSNLEYLYIGHNQLTGSIPPELGNLINLVELELGGTTQQLTGTIPSELGNLTNLQALYLHQIELRGPLPESLTHLTQLNTFYFWGTDLCELPDAAFQSWLGGITDLLGTNVMCALGTIPTGGGTLPSVADHTTYNFSTDTFTDTIIISHVPISETVPALGTYVGIRHAFDITVVFSNTGQSAQPTKAYTITIQYTENELGPVIESTLALFFWNGSAWEKEPTSSLNMTSKIVTANPNHFSEWAVLGEVLRIYLPIGLK